MGVYLNNKSAYTLYKSEAGRQYFVDKTMLLEDLFPMVQTGNNHICITRPRRFGKSVMANMIAAFFSKGRQAQDLFGTLKISASEEYEKHLNQYSVIQISMNELERVLKMLSVKCASQFKLLGLLMSKMMWEI